MGNIITGLVPVIYRALDTIPRELCGAIPGTRRWPSQVRVAKNQTITFPIVPKLTATDMTAAASAGPNPNGITIGNDSLSMTNIKTVDFPWTGEEAQGLSSNSMFAPILQDEFAQAFRTLANAIETDICALATYGASAYGTAGLTPFGTANDLSDLNFTKKNLKDRGCPQGDLHLVLDTDAHATLQSKQTVIYKANEYGSREGILAGTTSLIQGVNMHESGFVASHTSGTMASDKTFISGAKGDTVLTLNGYDSTAKQGDVLTIGNDKYVVAADQTSATIVIQDPGLRVSAVGQTPVDSSSYVANFMFDRNAIVLISALPSLPPGGDIAADTQTVVDPITGLQFEIAIYKQYMQNTWSVRAAWGVKLVKPDFVSLLLG